MIYTQTRTRQKIIELLVVFSVFGIVDQYWNLQLIDRALNPLFFITMLVALRYGLYIGLLSFILSVGYHVIDVMLGGGDLFLAFYDGREQVWLFFNLIIAFACGLFSTSWQERYESLRYRNDELLDDNKELKDAVNLLEDSQRVMEEKMLESKHSLSRVLHIAKALDQPTPELIRNEAITLISDLFETNELALYHVNASKETLRLRIRKGTSTKLPQTLFVEEGSSIYKRLFQTKSITIRTVQDEHDSPTVVGPLIYDNEIQEVLVIDHVQFERLTSYEVQVLSLILEWTSSRIRRATEWGQKEEETYKFKGTSVYNVEGFKRQVELQQKRGQQFDLPFSLLKINLSGYSEIPLTEMELNLKSCLREIDVIGYDPNGPTLHFLLPGTAPDQKAIVESRIREALQRRGGLHVYES
ncbi:hypothetical protein N781_09315 [Pontibacillus halophilus JSM 076056 = DSM 19796]|uniref:GAF domain-containing protein n=1 Tax=Pontibacillus halophilus JSM 076056 = DSM 19796 TaxID=1385510 RepID=A0A0A5GDT7_9BACI|nr:hypothetical protein [Pontibacillus halophilus]KGX89290.1 hypothetical protein N781_09315 [Pontibacillus halophilus JSM 076056 = DSM 19796]